MRYYLPPPPLNPLARIVAAVLAVAALVGAFFFGLVILVLAVGLGVLAWLFLSLRVWWLRRQMRRAGAAGPGSDVQPPGRQGREGDVIDAEYEVISRRDEQ